MKQISLVIATALLAFLLINCEKTEIEPGNQPEIKNNDGNRISFLKSSQASSENYEGQQDFSLYYASQISKTDIAFVVEYLAGNKYKKHDFDFIWNEKYEADNEGKLWMNLDIYHKTKEENAISTVQDSTLIKITALEKIDDATAAKLWLRFRNTTDAKNEIILQYNKPAETNTGTTGDDHSENSDNTNNSNDTIIQDSTQTS
jgi:hypothetical protein